MPGFSLAHAPAEGPSGPPPPRPGLGGRAGPGHLPSGAAAATGRAVVGAGPSLGQLPRGAGGGGLSAGPERARAAHARAGEPEAGKGDLLSRLAIAQAAGPSAALRDRGGGRGLDFDDEARKLWARLNLDPSQVSGGQYNALDPLWRHPQSGGTFFVGNQTAASQLKVLSNFHITHVVNCTDSMPLYHDRPDGPIKYFRFDICSHGRRAHSDAEAVAFVEPMLSFVGAALARGQNVMVHCLAGAHRAGTTGVICLMHFAGLSAREAVPIAKRCRPIIDPIGDFPQLLMKLERGWRASGRAGPPGRGLAPAGPAAGAGPVQEPPRL